MLFHSLYNFVLAGSIAWRESKMYFSIMFRVKKIKSKWWTYRNQEFLNFIHCPLKLHFSPILCILHSDQHMELVVQMFPIRFTPILLFLQQMLNQNIHSHKSVSAYVRTQEKLCLFCFAKNNSLQMWRNKKIQNFAEAKSRYAVILL